MMMSSIMLIFITNNIFNFNMNNSYKLAQEPLYWGHFILYWWHGLLSNYYRPRENFCY